MNVLSGAPVVNLLGIEDRSIRTPLPEGEALPMHLPWLLLNTQRGPEETQLVAGGDTARMYGAESFDEQGPYTNHATMMHNVIAGAGNITMIRRYISDAHKKASLRLAIEVVDSDITVYQRDSQGLFIRNASGSKVPVIEGGGPIGPNLTVPGKKVRWVILDPSLDFGTGSATVGDLAGSDTSISNVYPILDIEASHFGKYGNNVGLSLSCPSTLGNAPVNEEVVYDNLARLFRLKFVEREDAQSAGRVQKSLFGGQDVEFTFKKDTVNKSTGVNLHMDRVVPKSYADLDSKGFAPIYGPMDNYHVYDDNLETVLELLATDEFTVENGYTPDDVDIHLIDPISAVDVTGAPYRNIEVVGPEEGGILLGDDIFHYAKGGSDGDQSLTGFDTWVGETFNGFENDTVDALMDSAQFPFSVFYDSGFTMDTKLAMLTPIGLRKDVYTVLSTQDVTQPANDNLAEMSIAIALRARARLFPESVHYGTATTRALIVGHSGTLLNSNYTGQLPLTIDFASKSAQYMGAAEGSMKEEFSMDTSPVNNVTMFRDINNTYKSPRVRQRDWAAGIIWVQRKDRNDFFYPQYQTVYDNDTSIINSALNMFIGVELEKVCERTWRNLTGDSKLSDAQFFEKSNALIERYTRGRFDGRVTIVAETFKSEADKLRGYSWSCNLHMYGNNMRTVGTYTVTANRAEDLV